VSNSVTFSPKSLNVVPHLHDSRPPGGATCQARHNVYLFDFDVIDAKLWKLRTRLDLETKGLLQCAGRKGKSQ
jgi:hypothetical protein